MPLRPCLDCGRPAEGTRCEPCRAIHAKLKDQRRPGARQRGYDTEHDRTRARLLPLAYGTPCPRCGHVMTRDQDLDLGHTVPLRLDLSSRADRIEHAWCNRAANQHSDE